MTVSRPRFADDANQLVSSEALGRKPLFRYYVVEGEQLREWNMPPACSGEAMPHFTSALPLTARSGRNRAARLRSGGTSEGGAETQFQIHPEARDEIQATLARLEPSLRQAFVARYGPDLGTQAAADAMAWAWEHRAELGRIGNLPGYLFRVGQSSLRWHWTWTRRRAVSFPPEDEAVESNAGRHLDAYAKVDLAQVVERLSDNQRICVLLVHAHRWTYQEVADLLDISSAAVANHISRGLTALRRQLKDT